MISNGAVANRICGSVIPLNFCQRVAPSTSAASYHSVDILCNTPENRAN